MQVVDVLMLPQLIIHFPLSSYVIHSSSIFLVDGTCFIDYFIEDYPFM